MTVDFHDRTLHNGLRVLAVRQGTGPQVEVRLTIPSPALTPDRVAAQTLLGHCLTTRHTVAGYAAASAVAAAADFVAWSDYRRIGMSVGCAVGGLDTAVRLLAEAVAGVSITADELDAEREQFLTELRIGLANPDVPVRLALLRQLFGDHPITAQIPEPDQLRATGVAALERLGAEALRPDRATLVVVGPDAPAVTIRAAESVLGDWAPGGPGSDQPPLPGIRYGDVRLLATPGDVRSRIRLRAPAVPQTDSRYPALMVASNVFGSGTSSRLGRRLREDKGYVYGVRCFFEPVPGSTLLAVEADTARETTIPAVEVIAAELDRMRTEPATPAEIDAARRYATGSVVTSLAARAAMASALIEVAAGDLDPQWLFGFGRRLAEVQARDVIEAAAEFFAPDRFSGLVAADLPAGTPLSLADLSTTVARS